MGLEYEQFKKYIQKLGFDIDIEVYAQLKEAVKYYAEKNDINGVEHYMKDIQNCGGIRITNSNMYIFGN
jgi:hypothetical protein